jgi:putative hydrolase
MNNAMIATKLAEYAGYLEGEGGNLYRARAYRRAAETVRSWARPVAEIVEEQGRAGLEALPGIGDSLAYTIEQLVRTGEFRTLRAADAHLEPDRLLTSLPGIGPQLANRLQEQLGVTTLEQLERAAHEGRLLEVGIGEKRQRGLLDALAGRLQHSRVAEGFVGEPSIEELLALDGVFRQQGEQGPPLFHQSAKGWRYRVRYANSALAHRLGRTRDWVVIWYTEETHSGQRTVVTETRGDLVGKRVVRGRERECRAYYGAQRRTYGLKELAPETNVA